MNIDSATEVSIHHKTRRPLHLAIYSKSKIKFIVENKPHKNVKRTAEVQRLLRKNGNTCKNCKQPRILQLDHIFPLSLGGEEDIKNYQFLCKQCHEEKTRVDILICHFLRKINVSINRVEEIHFYSSKHKVKRFYLAAIQNYWESRKAYKIETPHKNKDAFN